MDMWGRRFLIGALGLLASACDLSDLDPTGAADGGGEGGSGGAVIAGAGGAPGAGGAGTTVDPAPVDGGTPADGGAAPPPVGEGAFPDNDYCRPVTAVSAAQAALEQQTLELTNAARAQGTSCGGKAYPPVPALTMSSALRCAARAHSKDMIDRKFFDHTNPSGEGPSQRVARTGFTARSWGENIAAGNAAAMATMQQWLSSTGHCQNLMSGSYRQMGVGYWPGGSYRHYWTQVFATAR